MSLPVALRIEARAEFDEAAGEYERNREGLGDGFIDEVEAVLERIAAMPPGGWGLASRPRWIGPRSGSRSEAPATRR